jgi:hypothetical protein
MGTQQESSHVEPGPLTIKLDRTAQFYDTEQDGKPTVGLRMVSIADIILPGKRKPLIRLVADTHAAVLRDIASWIEAGMPGPEAAR